MFGIPSCGSVCVLWAFSVLISFTFGQDRPTLPNRFTTTIEGNIVNKNKTFFAREWFDQNLEKGKREFYVSDYVYTIYEDFSNGQDERWFFSQYKDDRDSVIECKLEAYSSTTQFSSSDETSSKHMASSRVWLSYYGLDQGEYQGIVGGGDDHDGDDDYYIRGLLATVWASHWSNVTSRTTTSGEDYLRTEDYDITFYYSLGSSWDYVGGSDENQSLPLRVEINGTHCDNYTNGTNTSYAFFHSYEYIGFTIDENAFDDDKLNFYHYVPDWVDECNTTSYCNYYPNASVCSASQGPPLPKLSNNFAATIEMTSLNSNNSYLLEQYYDYENLRAHEIWHGSGNFDGSAHHRLFLGNDKQIWKWYGDGYDDSDSNTSITDCTLSSISSNFSGMYDMYFEQENGHIASPSLWWHFNFSDMTGYEQETWMGYTTVRGIKAEKWKNRWRYEINSTSYSGVKYFLNMTVYHYFAKSGWDFVYSDFDNVPLRYERIGTWTAMNYSSKTKDYSIFWTNGSFDHIYDVYAFVNNGVKDSDFVIPTNWRSDCTIEDEYCDNAFNAANEEVCEEEPSMPTFASQFEAMLERTDFDGHTSFMSEYYDFDNNRAHLVYYGAQKGNIIESAWHQLEFFDVEQKWIWIGDGFMGDYEITNCSMSQTYSTNITAFDGAFLESNNHIASPATWFRFGNNSNAKFIGYDKVRGIDAQVWQGDWSLHTERKEEYKFTINSSQTFYFSKPGWDLTYLYNSSDDEVVPLRQYFIGTYSIQIYDNATKSYDTNITELPFEISYDFLAYTPGMIEEAFELPLKWRTECDIDEDYCTIDKNKYSNEDVCDDGTDLPILPQRFKATVESNIPSSNKSWLMEEYYDYNASKSKRVYLYQGTIYSIFEDFSDGKDEKWSFQQSADDLDNVLSCKLESFKNVSGIYHFTNYEEDPETNRLESVNDWFQFGEEYNEIYLGENYLGASVRGITGTRAWYRNKIVNIYNSTSLLNRTYNYDVTWYFGPKNWTYYGTLVKNNEYPLREVIAGDVTYDYSNGTVLVNDFEFYRDFIGFATGDDAFDGDDVFNFYNNMPNWIDECDVSSYCNVYPDAKVCSDSAGPPLPDLSLTFGFNIEINDAKNNKSYFMREYYDYSGNRAHIEYYTGLPYSNNGYHQLELLDDRQRWVWIGDATDKDTPLTSCSMVLTKFDLTGYDLSVQVEHGHLARPTNWFNFGANGTYISDETWMGYTTVRGITAEKWKSSYYRETMYKNVSYRTNATMYWYFSVDDWDMTFCNYDDSNVVLRAEVNGTYDLYNFSAKTGTHSTFWKTGLIDTWYEIVGFYNGTLAEEDFAIPVNWRDDCTISVDYCLSKPNEAVCADIPDLPNLPKAFSTTIEAKFLDKNRYMRSYNQYYDYAHNRLRVIAYPYRYSNTTSFTNSTSHFLANSGLVWMWNQNNQDAVDPDSDTVDECTLERAEQSGSESESNYGWLNVSSERVAGMEAFFKFIDDMEKEHYEGTEYVREIPCDAWKRSTSQEVISDNFVYRSNFTITYYFMQDSYKSEQVYGDYDIPVRVVVEGTSYSSYYGVGSVSSFSNKYEFINFMPMMPDDFWFIPPSNASCNITKFCNDLENVENGNEVFVNLCNQTENGYNGGVATTGCYISSCGEISEVASGGNTRGVTSKCTKDHSVPGYMWVVVVIGFAFGIGIGIVPYYRSRRKGSFQRIEDDGL